MKRPKGYVEWIHPEPPPESGYMIHSKLYYFKPQPNFNGRRIELIKANNVTATCRYHHKFIREVDLFAPEFSEEAFWARVAANAEAVKEYLEMLDTKVEGFSAESTDEIEDGDEELESGEDSDETNTDTTGSQTGSDTVVNPDPEVIP